METLGQVHLNTPFGNMLFAVASNPSISSVVEVGTWKGFGTTRCIMEALNRRFLEHGSQNLHFYSFESNLEFFKEAASLWRPGGYPFLHLCYGKLHENGLLTREQIEAHPLVEHVRTHYEIWYQQDVEDYQKAPFIKPIYLPPQIDMVVLDGGEFSGYADWLALKEKKPLLVCLDDTNVMKNERVYRELKEDKAWNLVTEGQDRHGWAIFTRVLPY